MEDNTKGFDSKKEFDAIADSETANLKITLLEKHLMESREAALELKRQELELRDKQLAIIAQMQNAVEENKAIDKRLADKIDESIEAVRTDMFTAWQESVKEAIVADARQLVESKLEEYDVIYRKQNEIIALQTKQADRILSTYRLFKGLCSTLIAVAIIVFRADTGRYIRIRSDQRVFERAELVGRCAACRVRGAAFAGSGHSRSSEEKGT